MKNMSKDESCCGPSANQSCGTGSCGDTNIEEIVKEKYSALWASGRTCGTTQKSSLQSDYSAHESLLKELNPQKGMKVLDVGSGNGETVLTIAEKVAPNGKAVGIDFSPEGIAVAKEKAKQRKLEKVTEFHLANAKELPFPDNTFDAAISECVVCLIPDKQQAIKEKARVVKPGGRVIMHDVITWMPLPEIMRKDQKLYCGCIGGGVSLKDYTDMMKKAGLADIKTVDFTKSAQQMLNVSIIANVLDLEDEKEFQEVVNFVRKRGIGYALIVGTKKKA